MRKKIAKIIGISLLVFILTILTQVGGLILLIFIFIWHKFLKRYQLFNSPKKFKQALLKTSSFLLFYLLISLFILPLIAKPFGRVPLPIMSNPNVKPLNILTCLLNRHYVKEELYTVLEDVSVDLNKQYPNTIIAYLDGNFPFINNFPLLPHLSHDDGEKLDLAFFYTNTKTGKKLNDAAPSFIGYGVFEAPKNSEKNQPEYCAKKGYWQYSILSNVVPQWNKSTYTFDAERTKTMVNLFAKHPSIGKLFIEPHLKARMKLHSAKIRYHGCGAVRHDDHLHIQL